MLHDTCSDTILATGPTAEDDLERHLLDVCTPAASRALLKRKRGRPLQLLASHLALGLLLCLLRGWQSQLDLWRMIRFEGVGGLPCLPLSDQAVYKRLAQVGQQAMHACFVQVTLKLQEQMGPTMGRHLAPFAREVLVLDESTLDQMKRWLPHLRGLPKGHDGLLAGRLAGLFDVRTQLWRRFAVLDDAKANWGSAAERGR